MTLGDTLLEKGLLHAAHFCYLMANVDFGAPSNKQAKLALLGADHRDAQGAGGVAPEAAQCTEIFEYIQKLSNPEYVMANFQCVKFAYAVRLVDHGMSGSALDYLEQVAAAVVKKPAEVNGDLLDQVSRTFIFFY